MESFFAMAKEMRTIHFSGFPIPPSSNNQYIQRGRFRVASVQLRAFKQTFEACGVMQAGAIKQAKEILKAWPSLTVHCVFNFNYTRVFTKKGEIKRMDVSNRIKAIHDCLSELIERDDSHFFLVSAEKRVSETEEETVDIYLSSYEDQETDDVKH